MSERVCPEKLTINVSCDLGTSAVSSTAERSIQCSKQSFCEKHPNQSFYSFNDQLQAIHHKLDLVLEHVAEPPGPPPAKRAKRKEVAPSLTGVDGSYIEPNCAILEPGWGNYREISWLWFDYCIVFFVGVSPGYNVKFEAIEHPRYSEAVFRFESTAESLICFDFSILPQVPNDSMIAGKVTNSKWEIRIQTPVLSERLECKSLYTSKPVYASSNNQDMESEPFVMKYWVWSVKLKRFPEMETGSVEFQ